MLRYLTGFIPDGFTTNLVRYPLATVVYIPLLVLTARRGGLGRFWVAAIVPALVNIVGQTFFAIAPYYLEAGMMSFLARISVIWSVLGAFALFPDERRLARSPVFWTGAAFAVVGFIVMSVAGGAAGRVSLAGALIILACSMLWGLYDVTVRHTMGKINPLVVFGVIGNYSSIGLILLAPLGEPRSILHLRPAHMALLVVSAYIGITFAHGLYYVAIQRLGVAVSAITLMITPFISLLGSWLFLDERFTSLQWLGGGVLIAGATLALWSRQPHPGTPPELAGD